jgi:hypothetical protein
VVNLRPETDPETEYVSFDRPRVLRVLAHIIADLDGLVGFPPIAEEDVNQGVVKAGRARNRRRLAESDPPPKPLTVREERAALEEADLTFVCFERSWMKMSYDDQAWRLVKEWNKIAAKVRSAGDQPRIDKVHWGRSVKIDDLGETRRRGRHGPR